MNSNLAIVTLHTRCLCNILQFSPYTTQCTMVTTTTTNQQMINLLEHNDPHPINSKNLQCKKKNVQSSHMILFVQSMFRPYAKKGLNITTPTHTQSISLFFFSFIF